MIERMLLIVLIWILNWSNFHAIYLINRSSGVYSGRLVHGRWSDHTLQCNHWWAFSGIGVSAAELWRLWQTSSGLADRSIRPFQGTGLHVCTCELIDMSEIYIHLKNDYKYMYYHLQVAWKCSILKVLNLLILFHYEYLSHTLFQYNYCCIFHTAWHVSIFPANFLCFNGTFTISTLKFVDGIWWPIFWTCGLSGQIQQSDYKIHGNGMAGQPQ